MPLVVSMTEEGHMASAYTMVKMFPPKKNLWQRATVFHTISA